MAEPDFYGNGGARLRDAKSGSNRTQPDAQGFFFGAQGLHGFLAAHGLQGLHGFLAAHGLQGLQAFLDAHGLQGLHGFFFAAQGLQGLQAELAARISGFCWAAGLTASVATTTLDAEMANTPPAMAAYSGLRLNCVGFCIGSSS
jgi:hypothetical protein